MGLPASCDPPLTLPDDPLTPAGTASFRQEGDGPYLDALDVAVAGDWAYVVGQGGLVIVDLSESGAPAPLFGPWAFELGKLHRVAVLSDGLVATSQRELGVSIWDVSDPSSATVIGTIGGEGMEGLAWAEGRLYVTVREEGVRAYDLADPQSPILRGAASGLDAPWVLAAPGDGWLSAADNVLGVVPIDVTDPDSPVVGVPVALDGAALHAAYADDRLYVASGGDGVVVLDVSRRGSPVVVGAVETGGSAVAASVAEDRLWVVDHEGITVFGLGSDLPTPLQREATDQFALAVAATGHQAVVGDWNDVEIWSHDPTRTAGALDLPSRTLRLRDGVAVTPITNRGGGPLNLLGAGSADPRAIIEVSASTLGPGETGWLRVRGLTGEVPLCLASDDPDEPVLPLIAADRPPAPAGVPAPDFELVGLDGETRRLSNEIGSPVLLVYFATW